MSGPLIQATLRWGLIALLSVGCGSEIDGHDPLDAAVSMDQGVLDSNLASDVRDHDREIPDALITTDSDVSPGDAAQLMDAERVRDLGPADAQLVPDERLVNDPLDLTNEELFGCEEGPDRIVPSRVWRLNRSQYAKRIGRLIGGDYRSRIGTSNPFDGIHSGEQFSEPADAFGMDGPTFDLVMQSAEGTAEYVTDFGNRWLMPPCVHEGRPEDVEACWDETVRRIARSIWERPATDEEVARYLDAARGLAAEQDRVEVFRFLVRAILISPYAYFRMELGRREADAEGRHRLTGHEVATVLAHSIQDGPADDLLASAADDGRLETVEDIQREVRRLLGRRDDRAAVARFFREFFGHGKALSVFKDPVEFPRLNVGSEVRSVDHTIDYLVSLGGDTVDRLLTSPVLVPDSPLSCPSCADSEDLGIPGAPRRQDEAMRAGILTHRGWLMAHSRNDETDPVIRGKFVRERLLCTPVPDIPIGVIPQLPDPEEGQTMRERLETHNAAECRDCHALMDPIGLTFEMFDHVGLFQIGPNSPIDTTGELVGAGDADGPVANAVELSHRLAESSVVRRCFTRTAFRYWLGRSEQPGDACALSRLQRTVDAADGEFDDLLVALFTSDGFLYRTPPREEAP